MGLGDIPHNSHGFSAMMDSWTLSTSQYRRLLAFPGTPARLIYTRLLDPVAYARSPMVLMRGLPRTHGWRNIWLR